MSTLVSRLSCGVFRIGAACAIFFAFDLSSRATEAKPNVLLVLIDDMGWTDLGCYGNSWVETPAIDQLAAEGVRFTDFYANCTVCSPTRAALQSGRYQNRFGLTSFIPGHWRPFEKLIEPPVAQFLPPETITIAEALKAGGYRTGYFGKWHLGGGREHQPAQQGYDVTLTVGGSHFAPGFRTAPARKIEPGTYQTDFLAEEVERFLENEATKDAPFFAMVSPFAVHIPLQAKAEKIAKYEAKPRPDGLIMHPVYAAMVEHVDDLMARLLRKLDSLGLADNTVVIFTSDNGGLYTRYDGQGHIVTTNAPLRDEKGSPYEGGVRVPAIVRWPGGAGAGGVCDEPTMSFDFYPTLLAAAGLEEASEAGRAGAVDGKNLLPLLSDPSAKLDREALFWHYPHYHHSRPSSSVRSGNLKLIHFYDDDSNELYDLEADIGERHNIAAKRAGDVKRLRAMLDQWRSETGCLAPFRNDRYKPERAAEWWQKMAVVPVDLEKTRESILTLPFDGPRPPAPAQPKAGAPAKEVK